MKAPGSLIDSATYSSRGVAGPARSRERRDISEAREAVDERVSLGPVVTSRASLRPEQRRAVELGARRCEPTLASRLIDVDPHPMIEATPSAIAPIAATMPGVVISDTRLFLRRLTIASVIATVASTMAARARALGPTPGQRYDDDSTDARSVGRATQQR